MPPIRSRSAGLSCGSESAAERVKGGNHGTASSIRSSGTHRASEKAVARPFRRPDHHGGLYHALCRLLRDDTGKEGSTIAKAVMEKCEADFAKLAGFFGGIRLPKPLNVIVAALERSGDGSGGAYHHTCLAEDLYCDIKIHPTMDTDFTNFLVVAEAVEVFEAVQSAGWECGGGNGEGLSRVLATELYPRELGGYTTAAQWLDTPNRPDYVNQNNPTDRDPVTNGCAVLFLNYMHTQLNIGWDKIVQAGGSDLGQTYAHLGLGNDGFIKFRQLMDARFPIGKPSGVMTDNPFPL